MEDSNWRLNRVQNFETSDLSKEKSLKQFFKAVLEQILISVYSYENTNDDSRRTGFQIDAKTYVLRWNMKEGDKSSEFSVESHLF